MPVVSRTSSDYCLPLFIAETSVCSMAAVSGFERSFKASVIHLRDHINNSIGPEGFVQPCTVKFFPFLVRQVLFRDKGVGALCDGGFFHLIILLPAAGERRKASRWSFVIGGIRIIEI